MKTNMFIYLGQQQIKANAKFIEAMQVHFLFLVGSNLIKELNIEHVVWKTFIPENTRMKLVID